MPGDGATAVRRRGGDGRPLGRRGEPAMLSGEIGRGALRHRKVFLVLLDAIRSGRYVPGDALPTEAALGEMFGVSRITVRRALHDLALEGVIERKHGRGSFVKSVTVPNLSWYPIGSLSRQINEAGALDVLVLEFERLAAPDPVAQALDLASGAEVLRVVRVRSRDGQPIVHLTAWIPGDIAQRFTRDDFVAKPLYRLLAEAGSGYDQATQSLGACLADPAAAGALQVEIGTALTLVRRVLVCGTRPVEYLELRASPARYEIAMSWKIDRKDGLSSSETVTYHSRF